MLLSVGEGQMINLPRNVTSVWTSNPKVADVYVNSPRQINLFGKAFGEATVIATAADGSVVYGADVRVSQNISSINEVLHAAMPDSNITVTTVGQMAVINGTVASPEDAAQAEALVRARAQPGHRRTATLLKILPVNRLKSATPLQVTLKVRIAEVNRSLLKKIGVNLLAQRLDRRVSSSASARAAASSCRLRRRTSDQRRSVIRSVGRHDAGAAGKLFGLDLLGSLDLAADRRPGHHARRAEPDRAVGRNRQLPRRRRIPGPGGAGAIGAISDRVQAIWRRPRLHADRPRRRPHLDARPPRSQRTVDAGSVKLNGFNVPALTTRRAETTVELGSGQSFMIAGLLQNRNATTSTRRRSSATCRSSARCSARPSYQRDETELVIIVTPYLVRPVSGQLALPTDGYRAPTDAQRSSRARPSRASADRQRGRSGSGASRPAGGSGAAAPGFKL